MLYIAAEGAFGLKARIDAWEQGWHQSISDDDLRILPRPLNLTHYGELAELVTLIQQNGYGFVVIDTLARCMVGADENSAKDCGEVVAALLRLRQATPEGRGCVAGVHPYRQRRQNVPRVQCVRGRRGHRVRGQRRRSRSWTWTAKSAETARKTITTS